MTWMNRILLPGFTGFLEILVLAVVFYYILTFFQGTRGAQVLSGLTVLFILLLVLTHAFRLDTLNWLLQRFTVYLAVAFLVIFQPEIRRALAQLGRRHMFTSEAGDRSLVETLTRGVGMLAEGKIGALIAVERGVGTLPVQETGTPMDSQVTPELLVTIFYPNTPLHDGGVIIRDGRLVAAGCVFPLSQKAELSKSLGTRHRAAIGLTEESDAVVIVVSEETGAVSVAYKGRLRRGLEGERLERILSAVLRGSKRVGAEPSRLRRLADLLRMTRLRTRPSAATPEAESHVP